MRRLILAGIALAVGGSVGGSSPASAGFPTTALKKCAKDAVVAGTVCMDKYEATVWRVPDPTGVNKKLVNKIKKGAITDVTQLTEAGAIQLGTGSDDYAPCTDNGQNCANDIYAVSLPAVVPSYLITWFQAQEACANSGKRLPTNAEWQIGANGTPDADDTDNGTTDCNTFSTFAPVATGSRSACVSTRGAFDMVGNLGEWVADWVPAPTDCPGWGGFSGDSMCVSGASTVENGPAALVRGGSYGHESSAGPLTVNAILPSLVGELGFRCVR